MVGFLHRAVQIAKRIQVGWLRSTMLLRARGINLKDAVTVAAFGNGGALLRHLTLTLVSLVGVGTSGSQNAEEVLACCNGGRRACCTPCGRQQIRQRFQHARTCLPSITTQKYELDGAVGVNVRWQANAAVADQMRLGFPSMRQLPQSQS